MSKIILSKDGTVLVEASRALHQKGGVQFVDDAGLVLAEQDFSSATITVHNTDGTSNTYDAGYVVIDFNGIDIEFKQ